MNAALPVAPAEVTATPLADVIRRDLELVCYHEAGHHLAARHFGIHAAIRITPTGKPPTREEKAFSGQVVLYGPTTKFRMAVICWAGPLAEAAIKEPNPRECVADADWVWQQQDWIADGEEMSETDRAGMFGHPQVNRAARLAAKILARRFDDLEFAAKLEIELERRAVL